MKEVKTTARGFELIAFKDIYGTPCSLQQSSIVLDDWGCGGSAIWLGTDDAMPVVLWGDAAKVGIKTDATSGWVPYPIPPEVSLRTRAHLNREQVQELIVHLQAWLDTGSFKKNED